MTKSMFPSLVATRGGSESSYPMPAVLKETFELHASYAFLSSKKSLTFSLRLFLQQHVHPPQRKTKAAAMPSTATMITMTMPAMTPPFKESPMLMGLVEVSAALEEDMVYMNIWSCLLES